MSVYQYIAQSNPDAANQLCNKYGYFEIKDLDELAYLLELIVAQGKEQQLKDVMELHPEKEVLVELFQLQPVPDSVFNNLKKEAAHEECSCKKNITGETTPPPPTVTAPSFLVNQTNAYILGAALIISITILSIRK
jgi:hypothetical protein